jgi:GNAT superfamily N-acetyltransferase
MFTLMRKIGQKIRVEGLPRLILRVIELYLFSYQERYVFYIKVDDTPRGKSSKRYLCKAAGKDDLGKLGTFAPAYSREKFKEWLERGYWILIANHGETPVAFQCIASAAVMHPPISLLHHDDSQAWVVDIYTLPRYRKMGAASEIREFRQDFLRQQGFRRIAGSVLRKNVPSLVYSYRGNPERISFFRYIRIGVLSRIWYEKHARTRLERELSEFLVPAEKRRDSA